MLEKKLIIEDGENGTIEEVLIAPVGKFTGSDAEGKPIEQNFTEESLVKIAEDLNSNQTEVLLDKDHKSAKPGLERDTQALGWISKFVAGAKGLFGMLKLTKTGRELIENREYRHVSPTFMLGTGNIPTELVSVGATNCPAIAIPENVILNQEPTKKEETEMSKEEIVELIKQTVLEMKAEKKAEEAVEEAIEEAKEEAKDESSKEEVKDEIVENGCSKTKNEEPTKVEPTKVEPTKVEPTKVEPTKVEPQAETVIEQPKVEKKEEVIKQEVLNSQPTVQYTNAKDESWRSMKPEEFIKWIESGKYKEQMQ